MAMQYTQNITLDLDGRPVYRCVSAKWGDEATRFVRITLTSDGETVQPADMTAAVRCVKPDGGYIFNPAVINEDGTVTVELTAQMLAVQGTVYADLCLMGTEGQILSTASFLIQVEAAPSGEQVESSSEFLQLLAVVRRSEELIGDYESALQQVDALWQNVSQFPPTVQVTQDEGGHWVTVTDQNGTQRFYVANGAQGPTGESGTATDEQVAAWLDAHPEVTTSLQNGEVTPEKTSFILYDQQGGTETVADFTNQLPISTDASGSVYNGTGWQADTRINSSGSEVELEGFHVTGFIPCVAGDVVRTGDGVIVGTNDNQSVCRYDADKAFLGRISYNSFADNGFTVSDGGALYAPQSASLNTLAYIRIVGAGIGGDAIVTVNEEITYSTVEAGGEPCNFRLDEAVAVPMAVSNQTRIAALEQDGAPEYVRTEAERVAALAAEVQNGDTLTFGAISDLHYVPGEENTPAILHAGQALKHIRSLVRLDAAAMLGDIISGGSGDTVAVCKACYDYVNQTMADAFSGIPNLRLNGNHDCQPYNYDGFLTQGQIFARVGAWNAGAVVNGDDRGANYGYLDFADRKIRMIYLNTCDIGGISIKPQSTDFTGNRLGHAQLEWLIAALRDTPDGWGVIVLGHHPLDWVSNYYTDADGVRWEQNTVNGAAILSDFARRAAGSVWLEGIQYSYDFAAAGAEVIAYFHGHTHNFVVGTMGDAGILRIAIPNALPGRENAYTSVEGMYEDASYPKTAGTAEDTALCIVTVDTAARKIIAHHYGAGYDREISY